MNTSKFKEHLQIPPTIHVEFESIPYPKRNLVISTKLKM